MDILIKFILKEIQRKDVMKSEAFRQAASTSWRLCFLLVDSHGCNFLQLEINGWNFFKCSGYWCLLFFIPHNLHMSRCSVQLLKSMVDADWLHFTSCRCHKATLFFRQCWRSMSKIAALFLTPPRKVEPKILSRKKSVKMR